MIGPVRIPAASAIAAEIVVEAQIIGRVSWLRLRDVARKCASSNHGKSTRDTRNQPRNTKHHDVVSDDWEYKRHDADESAVLQVPACQSGG